MFIRLAAVALIASLPVTAIADELIERYNDERNAAIAEVLLKRGDLLPANRETIDVMLDVIRDGGVLSLTNDQIEWAMSKTVATHCGINRLIYSELNFWRLALSPIYSDDDCYGFFAKKDIEPHWYPFIEAMAVYGLEPSQLRIWRLNSRSDNRRLRDRREQIRDADDKTVAEIVDKYPYLTIAAREDADGKRLLTRRDYTLTDRLRNEARANRVETKEAEQAAAEAREAETQWNAKWGLYHREWTSSAGTKIDAIFVSYADGQITLQGSNQSTITVALDDVSAEDRAFVRDQIRHKSRK